MLQVARMSMFNVFAAKSSKLEEFEQAQAQMTDQVSNTLRDGWVSSLKQVIRGSLRDVGKECSHCKDNIGCRCSMVPPSLHEPSCLPPRRCTALQARAGIISMKATMRPMASASSNAC